MPDLEALLLSAGRRLQSSSPPVISSGVTALVASCGGHGGCGFGDRVGLLIVVLLVVAHSLPHDLVFLMVTVPLELSMAPLVLPHIHNILAALLGLVFLAYLFLAVLLSFLGFLLPVGLFNVSIVMVLATSQLSVPPRHLLCLLFRLIFKA
ncbi:hypothetical protein L3X38_023494 [Prunus dulcis]|uniref:Uncharacterized protein n=1 Tax=Prunus dulcis TaxID=3755 RepID=A0AAD4VY37_PRUDU|nr:hypothetical protein L3X38_023494 [Prunus dulcis]